MIRPLILGLMMLGLAACHEPVPGADPFTEAGFADPPMKYRPVPLWFWNDTEVDVDGVDAQLRQMVLRDGYGGCAIIPFGRDFQPDYLGEEYMRIYSHAVDLADSLGAQMSLYDEYGFPSGSMGFSNADGVPRFRIAHPDRTIKRLDRHEMPVACSRTLEYDLDTLPGKLMAVAAYDMVSRSSVSLRDSVRDGRLVWTAPESGDWRVMVAECVVDAGQKGKGGAFLKDHGEGMAGQRLASCVAQSLGQGLVLGPLKDGGVELAVHLGPSGIVEGTGQKGVALGDLSLKHSDLRRQGALLRHELAGQTLKLGADLVGVEDLLCAHPPQPIAPLRGIGHQPIPRQHLQSAPHRCARHA